LSPKKEHHDVAIAVIMKAAQEDTKVLHAVLPWQVNYNIQHSKQLT
jgi:hypothetical protein